jgi:hypothetical protein
MLSSMSGRYRGQGQGRQRQTPGLTIVCRRRGSTTGLAKAVALTTRIPIVAVPTTYAGSEATNVWGLTENATKTTGVDDRVLPAAVVYDAELTLSLPVALSVASGLNALAHCVDSLWAPRADPINQALAAEGIRALADGLPRIAGDPSDLAGRETALYGAYLAAVSFASAGSGLHHKICHVLGGTALPDARRTPPSSLRRGPQRARGSAPPRGSRGTPGWLANTDSPIPRQRGRRTPPRMPVSAEQPPQGPAPHRAARLASPRTTSLKR